MGAHLKKPERQEHHRGIKRFLPAPNHGEKTVFTCPKSQKRTGKWLFTFLEDGESFS